MYPWKPGCLGRLSPKADDKESNNVLNQDVITNTCLTFFFFSCKKYYNTSDIVLDYIFGREVGNNVLFSFSFFIHKIPHNETYPSSSLQKFQFILKTKNRWEYLKEIHFLKYMFCTCKIINGLFEALNKPH